MLITGRDFGIILYNDVIFVQVLLKEIKGYIILIYFIPIDRGIICQ